MEIGLLAAFLGGTLALLSPCGALLLPAFFASTVQSRGGLMIHGVVFFGGLAVLLVPLGLGASFFGAALASHRGLLIMVAGWMIIAFGAMQVLGLGFDLGRMLPGVRTVQTSASQRVGLPRTFLLGTVSGVAGFCSGPILGAVLTMAATEDSRLVSGTMLAVYAAGMVVPLMALAAVWGRLGAAGRSRLRGRAVQVGPIQLHTTSVVTGLLLIAVGVVFLTTNGMAALPELVPAATLGRMQEAIIAAGAAVPEPVLIVLGALLVLGVWFWRRSRASRVDEPAQPEPVDA